MHPIVKRRCTTPLLVYPFRRMYQGDVVYGDPIEMKCYRQYRVGKINTATGEERTFRSVLYINGSEGQSITERDLVSVEEIGKVQPLSIGKFPSLHSGLELVVVYI